MKANYVKYLKPIRTKAGYRRALSIIEELLEARPGSEKEGILEVLSILVERYEETKFPIQAPTPLEAIKFRMEQLGWTTKDLAMMLGSRSRASEILNRKRDLSLSMIRTLHKKMGVPAESLIGG